MATEQMQAYTNYAKHAVGALTSMDKYIMDVADGAIFTEAVDNFTVVELAFNAQNERTAKQATAAAEKLFLVAAVEDRYNNEPLDAFFNGIGERGRIVYLTEGLRFETSAFTKDAAITGDIVGGNVAHWDATTKKFIVHTGSNAGYANAKKKFTVLEANSDLGVPAVRLEVQ